MLVIKCPDCSHSFVWTDTMPLKGSCPTNGCSWTYDVHVELKKSVLEKTSSKNDSFRCPHCKNQIKAKWTTCDQCGCFVAGSKSFKKTHIFLYVAIILVLLSFVYRYRF
ncbi:MAG: hypothetical protein FJ139_01425 [Deltaproteobacteria bacterium]|nr:hypothetical protein [Deltaproteobacteria bacterium]